MFELHLDRLPAGRSTLPLNGKLPMEAVSDGESAASDCTVRGELAVDAMDQKVLVHGELQAGRSMDCHRCGRPTQEQYSAEVEILILRTPSRGGAGDFEEDDNWVIHQQGGVVDLTRALHEAVVLDEPLHVVCERADCKEEAVGESAAEDEIDPRWEKLKRLKDGGEADD